MRAKNDPPVFQRWSWGPFFPGHCLFVSDPSLYLDPNMGLAWYSGTKDFDPLQVVARKLEVIGRQLGLPAAQFYFYGSSGGGFAAIRMLTFMPDSAAISINPQTRIAEYHSKAVELYTEKCFGIRDRTKAEQKYPRRLSLIENADILRNRRIILIQNKIDKHHYEGHYKPFCAALGVGNDHSPGSTPIHRILFSHEGGHRKAESSEVFEEAMAMVTGGSL